MKASYFYPKKKGWLECRLLSIELNNVGTLLNVSIGDCYSSSVYLENVKKGDIKFK